MNPIEHNRGILNKSIEVEKMYNIGALDTLANVSYSSIKGEALNEIDKQFAHWTKAMFVAILRFANS